MFKTGATYKINLAQKEITSDGDAMDYLDRNPQDEGSHDKVFWKDNDQEF